jgi:alkylhydroperoxidase family enzyme
MEDTMARIPYPDKNSLPEDVQKLVDEASQDGGPGHILWMLSHSVNTVGLIAQLAAEQFTKLELPGSVLELMILFAARANSADYEWLQHTPLSERAGVTEEQRAALARNELTAACFNPQQAAALQLAAAVQAGPTVPIAVFQTAQKQFSNRQLVELVGVLGYYWMLGRVATVFQVDLDVLTGTGGYDEALRLAGQKSGQAH